MEQDRKDFARSLRQLAKFYEKHKDVPLPWNRTFSVFVNDKEHLAAIAKQLGDCEKEYVGEWFGLRKKIGDFLTIHFNIERKKVCERIVTGKKHVEEQTIPAHDVDVVEWKCSEPLLK